MISSVTKSPKVKTTKTMFDFGNAFINTFAGVGAVCILTVTTVFTVAIVVGILVLLEVI